MGSFHSIRTVDRQPLHSLLHRMRQRFSLYAATSPEPLPAPGLIITPAIRYQSELYLPIGSVRRLFYHLYRQALNHPPVFTSTPFHTALSWADCYATFPCWLQLSPNPARLVELLLDNHDLMSRFIFHSFLPDRFNGAGFGRYPAQLHWIRQLLNGRDRSLRLLDAACGSGEGTWELAGMLHELGHKPAMVGIEGWTLDPLEIWAAENCCLPHLPERSRNYQQYTDPLCSAGWYKRICFRTVDLLGEILPEGLFDLILCNGLLGGPIIHQPAQLQRVVLRLSALLAQDGVLLIADHFHGGWKKQMPESFFIKLLEASGLQIQQAGEGLAGVRRYT